jgi:hypothetical protein
VERTGIEPVTSDLQIPGFEARLGQIRSVNAMLRWLREVEIGYSGTRFGTRFRCLPHSALSSVRPAPATRPTLALRGSYTTHIASLPRHRRWDAPFASARIRHSRDERASSRSRRTLRRILPVSVFGRSATNSIRRG